VVLLAAYSAILRGARKVYSIDRVEARLEKAQEIGAIPINFSKGDPVAQIMKSEQLRVDRACDCCGYECVDALGKNVVNTIISNAINVVRAAGGIGVIGDYSPDDPCEQIVVLSKNL
jgi:threonine dehydrogenase-like Zn-dependent dehydrogenase